ncbi:MAG: hypothetical protein LUG18_09785 [Candidatus Azobacteroides sp.]|nr:hypothetical protein [Candidatus Azobacteroides sp.]
MKFSPEAENGTSFRILANAEISPFLKPMVAKPLQDAIDKMAETFAVIIDQQV